ncbi:MAG: carbohydrate ABC transporter permease [Chloroflexota bacterium]
MLEEHGILGYVLMAPALLVLLIFIAYPFLLGVWLSVTDRTVGVGGAFVGLKNFVHVLQDDIFQQTLRNTFVYTAVTTLFKFTLGMALALLLHREFRGRNIVRAWVLLPWIVPTVLSALAWLWIFDNTYSVVNWFLVRLPFWNSFVDMYDLRPKGLLWLGDPNLAMFSIMTANIWRGIPFFAISLLAGLQTIPVELHEAAAIDGAGSVNRFFRITLPLMGPVITIVLLFSIIWTFADFQLVYVLTRGGPANSTHLLATYAFQLGMGSGLISEGAAISLVMLPFLLILIILQLAYVRRS